MSIFKTKVQLSLKHPHLVNSMMYREITGQNPPHTPITARSYAEHGYPWFALYDDHREDLAPSDMLAEVKSVKTMDEKKGFTSQQDDDPVAIAPADIKLLDNDKSLVNDGKW